MPAHLKPGAFRGLNIKKSSHQQQSHTTRQNKSPPKNTTTNPKGNLSLT
jgi:hypothetical protein